MRRYCSAAPPASRRGPLRPNWLHILIALADGDRHGSAIARDVLEQTDDAVRLWPATLYRALDDMVAAGLIRELTGVEHPQGESARLRFYQITGEGRRKLAAAVERMAALAGTARSRLRRARS